MRKVYLCHIFILFLISCNESHGVDERICINNPLNHSIHVTNKYDSIGNKTGLWAELHTNDLFISFYKDGNLNGISRSYHKCGNVFILTSVGSYVNDKKVGQWQYYSEEDGHLMFIVDSISKIDGRFIVGKRSNGYKHPGYQSYIIDYQKNGNKRCEGWCLFWDDPIVEYEEIGLWKYYDANGHLTSQKMFLPKHYKTNYQ